MTHDHWPPHIHDTRPFDGRVVCHGCDKSIAPPFDAAPAWCARLVREFVSAHLHCRIAESTPPASHMHEPADISNPPADDRGEARSGAGGKA
jgi:predicted amidophosphoribosyltransferase